jgi:chromosome segregation protein
MERAREIDELATGIETLEADLARARAEVEASDEAVLQIQETLNQQRRQVQEIQQRLHTHQMELLKLNQARARFEEQLARIARDEADQDSADRTERERLQRATEAHQRACDAAEEKRARLEAALESQRLCDAALREARSLEQAAARDLQEARFSERECVAKLEEVARLGELAHTQLTRIEEERGSNEAQLEALDEARVAAELEGALEARAAREAQLVRRRDAVEGAAARLRELDELRLKTEHVLAPLRGRLHELSLKEQAAKLSEAQFEARLQEAQVDEAAVRAVFPVEVKEVSLTRDINRLTREIAEMGAVNLAALDELTSARERKGFLDAQSEDLTTAINTLEDAIRRIDRETREQLIATYDIVNRHFGQLFPQLFGGGQARLVMTGEEILDAGIQVIAQPPGKKNASIQLLSGGEKALTAIALVFSLFQLNPAPFCMLDEVDAPLDDSNTERFCDMVKRMSEQTQFIYISHNKITMEMAHQLVGVTMQEQGCSRVVEVDIEEALKLRDEVAA